jgi:CTP synthase (UTP-ammonia lyase)
VLVEYARNVVGIANATHAEVDASGEAVVVPLACSLIGERRTVRTVPGTRARMICGERPMLGYHFCGYGANRELLPVLEAAGLVVSGYADDGTVEIVELPEHPFFLASLFQSQVTAGGVSADAPLHPLLVAFADAVFARCAARHKPELTR